MHRIRFGLAILAVSALGSAAAFAAAPKTIRVSVKQNGNEVAGAAADYPAISASGRFVAFETFAKLRPADSGASDLDIYVWDRTTGKLDLVSVRSDGDDGVNFEGERADISATGRWVSFASDDPFVAGDANGKHDIYRYDRRNDKITLVSLTDTDSQLSGVDDEALISGISDNGNVVAWESLGAFVGDDTNNEEDIFVRRINQGTTQRVSIDNADNEIADGATAGRESQLALSGGGGRIAWQTTGIASPEGDFGFAVDSDVFVRDLDHNTTKRVSLGSNGLEADDSNNVNSGSPSITRDGRLIAFTSEGSFIDGDTNTAPDIYLHNLIDGTTRRVSARSDGDEVASFPSIGNSLPSISAGGRYISWETSGDYGGLADTGTFFRDIYRHDRKTKRTKLVSVTSDGSHPDQEHQLSAISDDGRWVAFSSMGEFTAGDDPTDFDVFLRGPIG